MIIPYALYRMMHFVSPCVVHVFTSTNIKEIIVGGHEVMMKYGGMLGQDSMNATQPSIFLQSKRMWTLSLNTTDYNISSLASNNHHHHSLFAHLLPLATTRADQFPSHFPLPSFSSKAPRILTSHHKSHLHKAYYVVTSIGQLPSVGSQDLVVRSSESQMDQSKVEPGVF